MNQSRIELKKNWREILTRMWIR